MALPLADIAVLAADTTTVEPLQRDLTSLVVIAAIAVAAPFIVGLLRIRVAEVVLLIAGGIIFGPELLGWIAVDDSIQLLSQLGLGFLFFLAGMELEQKSLAGQSGRLAAAGWGVALLVAGAVTFVLDVTGVVEDFLGVSICLTSTALGTLLPILRDNGELETRFGRLFMGAGAFGELGPIIAISILLGTQRRFVSIITLALFGLIALLLAVIPRRFTTDRVQDLLERGRSSSSQTVIRLTVLLLVALLSLADDFGLDVVLGAFVAGIIVRRYSPPVAESQMQHKLDALAFGMFVPIFFVVSGALLDIRSIVENPLRLLLFFSLLLVARGLPQLVLYRRVFPDARERWRFSLLVATGLPIIVAVTTLEVQAGVMKPDNAAALVGAGALSVLVFPLIADRLRPEAPDPGQRREAAAA
jgi:Kef-type K+ transport system membrane component KefB